jgi:hypothetical protein
MTTCTEGKIKTCKISQPALIRTHESSRGFWYTGVVGTPYGFVSLYADLDIWEVRFIWQGQEFYQGQRTKEFMSKRVLAMKGRTLAKRVVRGDHP